MGYKRGLSIKTSTISPSERDRRVRELNQPPIVVPTPVILAPEPPIPEHTPIKYKTVKHKASKRK